MERLVRAIDDLRAATSARDEAARIEARWLSVGPPLKVDHDRLMAELERLSQEARRAESITASSRTILELAIARRDRAVALADAPECDHCGQPLTKAHLREERTRRANDVRSAEHSASEAVARSESLGREETAIKTRADAAFALLNEARDGLRTARKSRLDAEARIGVSESAVTGDGDPNSPRRSPPRSIPPALWPPARTEVKSVAEARRRVRRAEETHKAREDLLVRLASARTLRDAQAAHLPEDPSGLRDELSRAEADHVARLLGAALKARVGDRDRADRDLSTLSRSIAEADSRLSTLDASLSGASARVESARAAIDRAESALPEAWRGRAHEPPEAISGELRRLEASGVEARAEALRKAMAEWDMLSARHEALELQIAAIPEEARVSPELSKALVAEARDALSRAEDAALAARHEAERLDRIRAERAALAEEKISLEGRAATAASLAKLLGPRGLQRHLVRRAEREILRFANERLDRLSGGALSLRLRPRAEGETDETALDLEAHDRRARRSVAVAFLSGSQKFRVAVSLALAIGRLAATNARPIESVIIDEGFGCLDREGRQVMIRELRNLGQGVRRVLLVSHQEEFADAFPDGCRLSIVDGSTIVGPLSP